MQDTLAEDGGAGEYRWSAVALGQADAALEGPVDGALSMRYGVADIQPGSHAPWYPGLKRAVDLVLAIVLLACLLPLFAVVALLIKLDSPGPVLYGQERVGRGGRIFRMWKFRSMYDGADRQVSRLAELNEADGPLFKIRQDPRLTRLGRLLRRSSVDELPQLINVALGQMSLVGPRPPLQCEVEQYTPWQRRRLEAFPGMTGLWQINGRSDLPFDEGMALDVQYVHRCGLLLDLSILLRTIPAVCRGRGAY